MKLQKIDNFTSTKDAKFYAAAVSLRVSAAMEAVFGQDMHAGVMQFATRKMDNAVA